MRDAVADPPPGKDRGNRTMLHIKYMVSIRCKLIVKDELKKLGFHYSFIDLGEVQVEEQLSRSQWDQLNNGLKRWGLELMEDKNAILIERIKNVIIETIHYSEEQSDLNFFDLLSKKLEHDYTYLSHLFSTVTGSTIERFIIMHKIERVKELLIYDKLTLSEIAFRLHYSSVAHLSNQFKKVTGLSPTFFKHLKRKRFSDLENV
jgi:AraC-like DNA-binding protein